MPTLTPPEHPGEDRSPHLSIVVTVAGWMILAAFATAARADEQEEGSDREIAVLVRKAIGHADLDGSPSWERRARAAIFWPSLEVGATVKAAAGDASPASTRRAIAWELIARLSWPLERLVALTGAADRMRAAERAALVARVTELGQRRQRLAAVPRSPDGDPLARALDRLDAEELDAELDGLTRDEPEGP